MSKPTENKDEALVKVWNQAYEPGMPVMVTCDDGSQRETKTRSAAWVLGGHSAVIQVEGVTGCYSLWRVKAN